MATASAEERHVQRETSGPQSMVVDDVASSSTARGSSARSNRGAWSTPPVIDLEEREPVVATGRAIYPFLPIPTPMPLEPIHLHMTRLYEARWRRAGDNLQWRLNHVPVAVSRSVSIMPIPACSVVITQLEGNEWYQSSQVLQDTSGLVCEPLRPSNTEQSVLDTVADFQRTVISAQEPDQGLVEPFGLPSSGGPRRQIGNQPTVSLVTIPGST